ncbi:uncharacterized protein OCT59_005576 [Rhizophagus irregularis]|uniref:uncharacterized protein n=1 Tax=Rhizophagus irregularis TaxID=588596 RepID=UPI0033198F48|nr:hypothetical protein OCT59_005576 [Rhizophagus irregularis]
MDTVSLENWFWHGYRYSRDISSNVDTESQNSWTLDTDFFQFLGVWIYRFQLSISAFSSWILDIWGLTFDWALDIWVLTFG